MFTEAQILYLREVLGASVDSLRRAQPATAAPTEVTVLAEARTETELQLLEKILSSVQLFNYQKVSFGEEADIAGRYVLAFDGQSVPREELDASVWWHLPKIADMSGESPAVAALKRQAWNVLQNFAKERRP